MKAPALAFFAVALQACSSQQVYNAIQQDRQLACQRYPDTRYEACMKQSATPYREYEETLEAIDKEGP